VVDREGIKRALEAKIDDWRALKLIGNETSAERMEMTAQITCSYFGSRMCLRCT
jgi:hypothetical protein